MPQVEDTPAHERLRGERIAFIGRLAGMPKREAQKLVRAHGGVAMEQPDGTASLLVVGEEELPLGDLAAGEGPLDGPLREAAEAGRLEIVRETQLWQRLGLIEPQAAARRLYTPAMLAELLGVPVAVIRRWHRKGLIVPAREVRRLPYFDFQEVATARSLAQLLAAGCSPQTIERKLAHLGRYLPGVDRPLAQLSVIVEGKQLLLRQGDGLVEPGGQLRIDFEPAEQHPTARLAPPPAMMPRVEGSEDADGMAPGLEGAAPFGASAVQGGGPRGGEATPDEILSMAAELEDQGQLAAAADMYRALLAGTGPSAEVNFCLAEVLYRLGDLAAARERYFVAIELDEDYVEARANLGCVLAELGEMELAVAAFQGALSYHGDYPDVHYHLARTLDELNRRDESEMHWRAFLSLAPDSPWAEQARRRLEL